VTKLSSHPSYDDRVVADNLAAELAELRQVAFLREIRPPQRDFRNGADGKYIGSGRALTRYVAQSASRR
jgi:hypothetical protein